MFRKGLKIDFKNIIINIGIVLISVLISLFLLLLLAAPLLCKEKDIKIYHGDKFIQSMTIPQFETLIKSAEQYDKQLDAEENNRVKIFLKDDPWNIKIGESFITEAKIVWLDKDNKELKIVVFKISLTRTQGNKYMIALNRIYTQVAKTGFPVTLVLTIILLIIAF